MEQVFSLLSVKIWFKAVAVKLQRQKIANAVDYADIILSRKDHFYSCAGSYLFLSNYLPAVSTGRNAFRKLTVLSIG